MCIFLWIESMCEFVIMFVDSKYSACEFALLFAVAIIAVVAAYVVVVVTYVVEWVSHGPVYSVEMVANAANQVSLVENASKKSATIIKSVCVFFFQINNNKRITKRSIFTLVS